MTNQEMRSIQQQLDINYFKINYKSGVHYGIIEDFFNGKTEDLSEKDRQRIIAVIEADMKKNKR